jgi:hypothetical protein
MSQLVDVTSLQALLDRFWNVYVRDSPDAHYLTYFPFVETFGPALWQGYVDGFDRNRYEPTITYVFELRVKEGLVILKDALHQLLSRETDVFANSEAKYTRLERSLTTTIQTILVKQLQNLHDSQYIMDDNEVERELVKLDRQRSDAETERVSLMREAEEAERLQDIWTLNPRRSLPHRGPRHVTASQIDSNLVYSLVG